MPSPCPRQVSGWRRHSSTTTVYYGHYTAGDEPERFAGLDAVIAFDAARARQGLWPAVDPLRSRSRLLQSSSIGEAHARTAAQAPRVLRRYRDLEPMIEKSGLDALSNAEDRQAAIRARRLDRFLTQPFAGAEPWTGIPGQHVPLEETIHGCQ